MCQYFKANEDLLHLARKSLASKKGYKGPGPSGARLDSFGAFLAPHETMKIKVV